VEQLERDEAFTRAYGRLLAWGVTPASARCVADHLIESELTGHPSHGLRQLLRYQMLIDTKQCDPGAVPTVISRSGPVAKIDGGGGFGHPAMHLAVDTAVSLARDFRIGLAAVVRAGHTGRMGAWVEQAADAGMFGMALLAAKDPPFALAASPGAAPVLRTNPLSLGAPTTKDALILDMAMSVVSESSIVVAASRGEEVPSGAFADRSGGLSTDPRDYLEGGALLPAGGYKGFGLAVMIEALCIGLTGADEPGLTPVSGALVICIAPSVFREREDCLLSNDALQQRVRDSGGSNGSVGAPGDRSRQYRASTTVTIDDDVREVLL
jgi:LDH2 family malate/lactate/ureidoglycolate dehydrogenase